MPSSDKYNEAFSRLLRAAIGSIAAQEGKNEALVEEEFADRFGVAPSTIQRYKAGHLPTYERVGIFAEAGVQRGLLGRDWLQRFLHVGRHPHAEKMLAELCGVSTVPPRSPRVYHNLPAPTYTQFVMRQESFNEVIDGLEQRSAVVLITGLGGNGKTSLAREVATYCLNTKHQTTFDAVVWVSDQDQSGKTNHTIVLNEIARVLDYPGLIKFEHEEKRREIEYLIRRHKVLLVIDNFETITDDALLTWLLRLPEPSKALVTSREYSRLFRNSTVVVDLKGMSDQESWMFIKQQIKHSRIERIIQDITILEPILAATGGNPKAIALSLGLIKQDRRPLQSVILDLYNARGQLFDGLFKRAWSLLDNSAQQILFALSLFPTSACEQAIAETADIRGLLFDRAIDKLSDMSLLEIQQENLTDPARYTLHPLVRAFVQAQLSEHKAFEIEARERWCQWHTDLVKKVSFCWNNLRLLESLDVEQDTIYEAAIWAFQSGQYDKSLDIAKNSNFYYYTRGFWNRSPHPHIIAANSARHLEQYTDEVEALAYHVQLLSKQGNITAAQQFIPRIQEILSLVDLCADDRFLVQHAFALYEMACKKLDVAQSIWRASLEYAHSMSVHMHISNLQWLATCLYHQNFLEEAEELFLQSLERAYTNNHERAIISIKSKLASIYLDKEEIQKAVTLLEDSHHRAQQFQEKWYIAEIQRLYARLYITQKDHRQARTHLMEAEDLFERLGMKNHVCEVRHTMNQLHLL